MRLLAVTLLLVAGSQLTGCVNGRDWSAETSSSAPSSGYTPPRDDYYQRWQQKEEFSNRQLGR